tara:strand:- start:827 stop:3013 length:2187 start_codon:yes stop_codon:yes gene_type:complete
MKIVFKTLMVVFLLASTFVIYLSSVGIETSRFNNQIESLIKDFHKDLEIELKQVKIILDPFRFELNAKTIGPKLKLKDKIIELENIKTQIILNSFFNNDFSLKNLDISTRSLKIENLISFTRNLRNTPELYIFEKVLKKGYLICEINLEFDNKGKVKKNYRVKGLIKDAQIKFLKEYDLNKINFTFDFANKVFELKDIKLLFNNTPLLSEKIVVKNIKKNFLIEGSVENNDVKLEDKILNNFVKNNFPKLNFINFNLNSKNRFSFRVNKKFKINDFRLFSEIKIIKLKLENNLKLKNFFPNILKEVDLNDHLINLKYDKNKLSINGEGNIFLQDKEDQISYNLVKKNNIFDFKTNLIVDKNPIIIDLLGYKKKSNTKANLNLVGSHTVNKKTVIKSFLYNEGKNELKLNQLVLNKNLKIKSFKKITLDYLDEDSRENKIKIINKNKIYNVAGSKFNANTLINNLISDDSKDIKIFNQNFNFNIKIDQVYLDEEYLINNLNGNLNLKKNEIVNAELNAYFSKSKKLKFTVKTNQFEKVTTIFLDRAEPIVKRYKFIKGYNGGSLDFYSLKKGEKSYSNLKIYDFRLKELPILTKLLTLASLQGIADILSGEGITFDEFEMNFENQKNLMTIKEMYAIGPAISILMDGYIEKNKLISLRGSLVPATTINKAIGNIPVLGKILVGSKTGEGVFGVSFKIKGPPEKLETTVNPIKTLTPRFITRTLEKIKKN